MPPRINNVKRHLVVTQLKLKIETRRIAPLTGNQVFLRTRKLHFVSFLYDQSNRTITQEMCNVFHTLITTQIGART